jgi:hypothetical protein
MMYHLHGVRYNTVYKCLFMREPNFVIFFQIGGFKKKIFQDPKF